MKFVSEDMPSQTTEDDLPELPSGSTNRVLNPMERTAEVLFALIMVLTYTGSLSVATADHIQIRTMLIGALGCNFAWGIIDAGLYLMSRLHERGRRLMFLRAVRQASDTDAARRVIGESLPPFVASVLSLDQLETIRRTIHEMPGQPLRPKLTKRDGIGALGTFLLVFVSTFPVAIPFIFIGSDVRLALRVSNAVAITMLFLCGYAFGGRAGIRPWAMGFIMVAIGITLVGLTMKLGG